LRNRVLDGDDQALEFDRKARRLLVEAMQVPLRRCQLLMRVGERDGDLAGSAARGVRPGLRPSRSSASALEHDDVIKCRERALGVGLAQGGVSATAVVSCAGWSRCRA
jgi:hypothetical protein